MLKSEGHPQFSRRIGYGHYHVPRCCGIPWKSGARRCWARESVFLSLLLLRYQAPPTVLEIYHLTLFSRYSSTLESLTFQGQIPRIPAICDHISPSENLCWLASFIVQVLLCLPQLVQASAVINICSKYVHLYCFVLASSSGYYGCYNRLCSPSMDVLYILFSLYAHYCLEGGSVVVFYYTTLHSEAIVPCTELQLHLGD